jgi:uncharacterized delta-60 repeat protein
MAAKSKIMPLKLRSPAAKVHITALLALAFACNSALADGYLILDGGTLGDEVTHLEGRVPGHVYVGTKNSPAEATSRTGMLILDVAAALPSDPGPRVAAHAFPPGSPLIPTPIVGLNGSFFAVDSSHQVVARDAAGAVLFTSPPVSNGGTFTSSSLALQADGKVLIAGSRNTVGGTGSFAEEWTLTRLNADGTLDTSFQGGRVLRDPSPNDEAATWLTVAPNGNIVVSGWHDLIETQVGRFFADGIADFSFGTTGGLVPLQLGSGDVQVDMNQRVYVRAGSRLVTRLLEDGTLDSSYAGGSLGQNDTVSSMLLDSQNRIVLFGRRTNPRAGWIARLTTAGNPDATFGAAGTGVVEVTFPRPVALLVNGPGCVGSLQADDKPVIACTVEGLSDSFGALDIGLARFNTAGTIDVSFGTVPDADTYPDSFSFVPASVPYGTAAYVVSNPVTIAGVNVPNVTIGGGEYSVGCTDTFTSAHGVISNGQTACVRLRASSQPGGVVQTTLSVGGREATFTVTASNSPADSVPDSFAFVDQSGVAVGTVITSARINVTGLTGFATSTITGGAQSFNCEPTGFTTDPIIVSQGGSICVRHTSSSLFSTAVDTVLSINGVTDTFTSTTLAAPPPPTTPPPSSGDSGSGGGGALDGALAMILACLTVGASRRRRRSADHPS